MKIMITGGAGFIGSKITEKLLKQNADVLIFDSFINYFPSASNIDIKRKRDRLAIFNDRKCKIVRGSTLEISLINRTIRDFKPNIIIHMAAIPIAKMGNINSEEAFQGIVQGTVNMLEVVRNYTFIDRFIYTSSSMVYGDFVRDPIRESDEKNPINIYGGAKYAGEIMVESYAKSYGIEYSIVRPSAVYGPYDLNKRVVQVFIENALSGKKLILKNPESKLDFTYVDDIAEGFLLTSTSSNAKNNTFNITTGGAKTLRDLSEIIAKYFPKLKIEIMDRDEDIPERGTLDITKATNYLNYKPRFNLETGIEEYIRYMKEIY